MLARLVENRSKTARLISPLSQKIGYYPGSLFIFISIQTGEIVLNKKSHCVHNGISLYGH